MRGGKKTNILRGPRSQEGFRWWKNGCPECRPPHRTDFQGRKGSGSQVATPTGTDNSPLPSNKAERRLAGGWGRGSPGDTGRGSLPRAWGPQVYKLSGMQIPHSCDEDRKASRACKIPKASNSEVFFIRSKRDTT